MQALRAGGGRAMHPLMMAGRPQGITSTRRPRVPSHRLLFLGLLLLLGVPVLLWQWRTARQHAWGPAAAQQAPTSPPQQQQQQLGLAEPGQQDATRSWTSAQEVAAAAEYLHAVLHPQPRRHVPRKRYTLLPESHDMRQQHRKVAAYLSSWAFAAKQAARKAKGQRGLIINAGGPQLVTNAVVTLKVLRELLNCSLPVELVWHAPSEMDPRTLAVLQEHWGPIRGLDLSQLPWPEHQRRPPALQGSGQASGGSGGSGGGSTTEGHLPTGRGAAKEAAFIRKVQSLAASSFASALLLDADSMPLANPEGLWQDPSFKATGNLFWPDFWGPFTDPDKEDIVCDMLGLQTRPAMELLAAGRGRLPSRGSESGQLLLDLVAHGEVAEWALWANSFSDTLYRGVWGDKDTYSLAFAVAGRAHAFNQLQVPPGGAFAWRPRSLLVKATQATVDGWQLAGMVQFDALGAPAFLHRTMNKLSLKEQPWMLGLLTGPLPSRWLHYYLSLESTGPTVGVPVTYAAPASALSGWSMQPLDAGAQQQGGNACPTATFDIYYHLRLHGVPVGANATLDAACSHHLRQQLGPHAGPYEAAGLAKHPEVMVLAGLPLDGGSDGAAASFKKGLGANKVTTTRPSNAARSEAPDSPVPAWMLPPDVSAPPVATKVTRALAAANAALAWLRAHATEFPVLAR